MAAKINKPAIQIGVRAGTADDPTAYQRKPSLLTPLSVTETPTVSAVRGPRPPTPSPLPTIASETVVSVSRR